MKNKSAALGNEAARMRRALKDDAAIDRIAKQRSLEELNPLQEKKAKPYCFVRMEPELLEALDNAVAAHSKARGKKITRNKLITFYLISGLGSDQVYKGAVRPYDGKKPK